MKTKSNRRAAPRKRNLPGMQIKNLTTIDPFTVVARNARLVDVSSTGLLIKIDRKHLVPKMLRQNLSLSSIEGDRVVFSIREMDLEMDAIIARTKYVGDGLFEVALDFTEGAPEYWRQCLYDLIPETSEFEEQ